MPKLQEEIRNEPTRFDLYTLERRIEVLALEIEDSTEATQTLGSNVDTLNDNLEQLYKSIDALVKVIEKLPELFAKDQG